MTYHRLAPHENLYLLVYRTRADVVRYINFAAILTLVVSLMVIGLFCIIALPHREQQHYPSRFATQ